MRVEFYGCAMSLANESLANCWATLGVRDREEFPDQKFFGNKDKFLKPPRSRLNDDSGWCTLNFTKPYLGISVTRRDSQIVGVMTKGRGQYDRWVKSYEIGPSGSRVTVNGNQVLDGNHDQDEIVTHFFDTPIPLQNNDVDVVIWPQTWVVEPCVRFELIACDTRPNPCLSNPCQHGGTCNRNGAGGYTCACNNGFSGFHCEVFACPTTWTEIPHEVVPAGFEDGFRTYSLSDVGAWCSKKINDPWLEINFASEIRLYGFGFGTASNISIMSYAKVVQVSTRLETGGWQEIRINSQLTLRGPHKPGDAIYHYIEPRITSGVKLLFRYFREDPNYGKCARVDIKACHYDYCAENKPCQNGGTCKESDVHSFLCHCPWSFEGQRCELPTRLTGCLPSLGVANPNRIPDHSISADHYNINYEGKKVRLSNKVSAWCADAGVSVPTLRIGFGGVTLVIAIHTLGYGSSWVTEYKVQNPTNWESFAGNFDATTARGHYFDKNIPKWEFMLQAIQSNVGGDKCMRLELYGINEETLSQFVLANNAEIQHSSFTAKTFLPSHEPHKARWNDLGWCSRYSNTTDEYLQIELPKFYTINVLATKGVTSPNSWVKSFYLDHSWNGVNWHQVKINGIRTISGNYDFNTPQVHFFGQSFSTRMLKIIPQEWHMSICMRVDFFGCHYDPCENCNKNTTYCNESSTWTCKCKEGFEDVSGICKEKAKSSSVHPTATVSSRGQTGSSAAGISGSRSDEGRLSSPVIPTATVVSDDNQRRSRASEEDPSSAVDPTVDPTAAQLHPTISPQPSPATAAQLHPTISPEPSPTVIPTPQPTAQAEPGTIAPPGTATKTSSVAPVDGGYTEWGNWSACSVTCGTGELVRRRECSNPAPAHGGKDCEEPLKETKECSASVMCSGDIGFGEWSAWSSCSVTCGPGKKTRARKCSMADPGDSFCKGDTNETADCNDAHCPVDGGFSDWTAWSSCSKTCGTGLEKTMRSCNNPTPQHGGKICVGEEQLIRECEMATCQGDDSYTDWSSWTPCSVTCGPGTKSKTRHCLDKSGSGCTGPASETLQCLMPHCPVHGNFTEWTEWSRCLVPCGSGVIHRTRECTNPEPAYNGSDCSGLDKEDQFCSVPTICSDESGFTIWSQWSACDSQCSLGESVRRRECTDETKVTCNGTSYQNISCDSGPCPVDGNYTEWLSWSSCSGFCGSGLQNRLRTCTNPEPAYNGAGCSGASSDVQDCQHTTPCSGEAGYDKWSQWTLCTQTCGKGAHIRTRKCKSGSDPSLCTAESSQSKPCDKGLCPVHGNWAAWSKWGSCSASCGSGVKERSRTCTNPVPSYGGLDCFENSHDYSDCVMPVDCPGDDEFSKWSNWGSCSVSCGEGRQNRTRFCTVVPNYPPQEEPYCTEPTGQSIKCYNEPCIVNGGFTPWTDWSACTTSCGFGTRSRYRNCTNPPPLFGGSDCLGPLYEMKECENAANCPDDADFSTWTSWVACSSGCEGVMHKTRECILQDKSSCQSLTNVTMSCETQLCPVNGGWSMWTDWSLCSKTCGHQQEVRTRVCNNPVQRNGGSYCIGHNIEVMPCNEYDYVECPDPPPAEWSDWTWWTPCTEACGGGHQSRYRLCNNPPPGPGAPECKGDGRQSQDCNIHPCPVHGNYNEWSSWTTCTKECGNGTRVRGRSCNNPSPAHGGSPCEGPGHDLNYCNTHHCPIHGGYTDWSPWMFCNKPCGTGTSDRKRSCTNPTPMYGGKNCTGPSYEANNCNTSPCSPANILLDVTFDSVTMTEYNSDVTSFENSVKGMINSVYETFPPAITFTLCSAGGGNKVKCKLDLGYQSLAGDELVVLQDKLLDSATETVLHSMTSTNVFSSPLVLQATPLNSTSIRAEWPALPSSAETSSTSTLTGYVLFYKETAAKPYQKIGVDPSELSKTLVELKKFTEYRMVICPYSEKGNGIPSAPVTKTTLEDVPSVAPKILNISSPTSQSLNLSWTTVSSEYWNGIQRGYCVRYKARGASTSNTHNVTDVEQLQTVLTGLDHFTKYYVYVSAKTTPGCGEEASTSFVTLEYVPSEPPQNVNATAMTSTVGVLVTWDEVRPDARRGIIKGYKVSYGIAGEVVKWINVDGADSRKVNITGLKFLTEYQVKVLAYTSVGDGPECTAISITTEESTPSKAPALVEGRNTSSSSIYLKWEAIDPQYHQGTLLGYRVYYRAADTTRKQKMIEIPISDPNPLECHLTGLFWWWWYDIYIAGYTKIGTGVTLNVVVQTDEEVPSRYPENIRGVALTTTSMSFEWDAVLGNFAHGILIGYNLTVIETNNPGNVIVSRIIPHPERSYYVEDLKKFTNYTIWVSALNKKGEGPRYPPGHINSTGEDGPEYPPEDIKMSTLKHISEIELEWTRIPAKYHNGILRGYYVEYTATVLAGEVIPSDKRVVQSKRVRGNRYSTMLKNLDPGSTYEIRIFGYTSKNGSKSNASAAETCRCPKYLRSNWWVLPPYTNMSNTNSPGGIFFLVTRNVLDDMCGVCENGHGKTEFCYEEGCDKKRRKRRSSGNNYQKNSLQSVLTNIGGNVEVSFPVQGNRFMTTYGGVFPYISVVDAPGSAYFTVKNVPSTATVVVQAAVACMPLVMLMIFFAWIAGIIIWILERNQNNDHFPESFTKGVPEGFWWAYISMTTVGYGDRSPVTVPGRLFALAWILMGLVIISIVTGGIVTSITSVLVVQEDKIYGAKVGAIVNSAEYSKAVRQNADVVPYNNMEDLINAMHNKEVSGALLDMYAAATKKSMFEGGDIQLNRLIEYPTGYGFVLSGNMAKAAPLFRQALAAQKTKISLIVEENTDSISLDKNEADEAKEKSSGLFDPSAEAFQESFKVTMSLLAVAIILGLIWHFGKYKKKEKEKQSKKEKLGNFSMRVSS
ncbi:uncharacterized protein LOC114525803 isoform X3 [Dendronephthya gigantea]|uniref:uncharacterized protein LOC114525803 isoform X3 n=1 Tax=Dendronephthya gigantea TaxID=151771 RepID=UPI00106B0A39|nr:uncharacterized protein LOC114525803 isoform X3 [Dendronephthya gigantea]